MNSIILPCDTPLKQCTACLQWKPTTTKYFQLRSCTPDGFRNPCKSCIKEGKKCKVPVNKDGMKRCAKCKKWKSATLECFRRHSPTKLSPRCKECLIEDDKTYRATHSQYQKEYYQEHKEEASIQQKQRRKIHRDRLNEQKRQYFKTEHGRAISRSAWHRRRLRKEKVKGTLTLQQIQTKLKAQKYTCYYCFTKFKQHQNGTYIYHLEHTIPISRAEFGPRHDVNYVVLACPTCNLKKKNKLPHEFFEGGRLL